MTPDASIPGEMRRRVTRGLVWVGASQVGGQIMRAIVALVVARMLTPHEYGLAAFALIFASLVLIFSDLALGAALIQRKEISDRDRDTAFWITVGGGVLFTVLGIALAGPVAALDGESEVKPLLMVVSVSFVLAALGATQQSLMLRQMEFKQIELMTMTGTLLGGTGGVVCAAAGMGAWAIIVQQILATGATTLLVWIASDWRPGVRVSSASLRDLWSFSGFLMGQRLLYYVQVNLDRFLIGRFVGPAAMGTYVIGYNTILVPANRIGGPLQRVMAPAFARMQDEPERIAAAWARVTRVLALLAVPSLGGLVVVAPDFVEVALGDAWRDAGPIMQILAWVGILQALQSLNVDILMARDRTGTLFRFAAVFCVIHAIAFGIGLQWGVIGVAAAYAISSTIVEPILTILTARTLGVSPMVFVRSVAPVFEAALVMAAAVLALRLGLIDLGVPALPRLLLCVLAGIATFAAACVWRAPKLVADLRELLGRRAGGEAVAGA